METSNDFILITGAGGWLGSELTRQLLEKGKKIRALNFIETDSLKQLKDEYNDQLEIVIGDVCDKNLVEKCMEGINIVFHLAAKVHFIPTNKKEEEDFFNVNTKASEEVFKLALKLNIQRVIFFSTVSVYKETNEKITIDTEKEPITAYGKSKLEAEKIANSLFSENNLPITIVEPVTVYGEGDVGNFKKLENIINKGIYIKVGKGENKKTVIYYKDLIKMVIKIAYDKKTIGKTIICGTEVLSINKINDILIRKKQKKVFKIVIPAWLANFTIKICSFSFLKKIKRKLMALMQNNEIESNYSIDSYTKFEHYELKNN